MTKPMLYTIPASVSFVDALASRVLKRFSDDPLQLSQILILLPNRRSCRTLQEAFLEQSEGKASILPRIRALGDTDESELLLEGQGEEAYAHNLNIPPAITPMRRRLLLTRLVHSWKSKSAAEALSIEQAASLAIELEKLLDEVQRQRLPLDALTDIVPEDLAKHWQITLDFLFLLSKQWPHILAEEGVIDIIERRNLLLKAQAQMWQDHPPDYPIIAAGSTGSVPAVADLLKVIGNLPTGEVVLLGLDKDLDQNSWEILEEHHPQYGLKQLLKHLGVSREVVGEWSSADNTAREQLASEVMRPAETSYQWQNVNVPASALEGVSFVEAQDVQEEANAIALMLRAQLERKGKTGVLVTPDRGLARRVVSNLRRWGIEIDDSAGVPLFHTSPMVFLLLIAEMVAANFAPVALLAALKHPFASTDESQGIFRARVRALESAILRGIRPGKNLQDLLEVLEQAGHSDLITWLQKIEATLQPFSDLYKEKHQPLVSLLQAHIEVAQKLNGSGQLWKGDQGEQVSKWFSELLQHAESMGEVETVIYPELLKSLMAGEIYRPVYGQHPRLSILSPMEARLKHADLMVLGGLNEDVWPMSNANPWMNNTMRLECGLSSGHYQLGLSAHDFASFFCAPQVILTRAEKIDGSPALPSPWLLRLQAVIASAGMETVLTPKQPWLAWVKELHKAKGQVELPAPTPMPPAEARPQELSVTQIEKLMRDPYSLYAEKILGLKALEPIDKPPAAREYGDIIHQTLEHFVREFKPEQKAALKQKFLAHAKQAIAPYSHIEELINFWWPKLEHIAEWFVEWESERRNSNKEVLVEQRGAIELPVGVTLKAKADRIEVGQGGQVAIIDYKTGSAPSNESVRLGFSPQLSLEQLIAEQGGFSGITQGCKVTELAYWKITPTAAKTGKVSQYMEVSTQETSEGVTQLLQSFAEERTPYLSCPDMGRAPNYSDYTHLARIQEWFLAA